MHETVHPVYGNLVFALQDPATIVHTVEYARQDLKCDCTREWKSGKSGSKEARQLLWQAAIPVGPKAGDPILNQQVRFHLLAEVEFSEKLIFPFHQWTIDCEPDERSVKRCHDSSGNVERKENGNWVRGPMLGCGWRTMELSAECEEQLLRADAVEAAIDANTWTVQDAQRAGRVNELLPCDRWARESRESCNGGVLALAVDEAVEDWAPEVVPDLWDADTFPPSAVVSLD